MEIISDRESLRKDSEMAKKEQMSTIERVNEKIEKQNLYDSVSQIRAIMCDGEDDTEAIV